MTDTFPPHWTGPQFKTKTTSPTKKARAKKRRTLVKAEGANKRKVREREQHRCRFPRCGCHVKNLPTHVSHSKHKGMGGNPDGDRSAPELMVLICAARHRENRISIDKGTLRWRELEAGKGSAGPLAWDIKAVEVPRRFLCHTPGDGKPIVLDDWLELARERSRGVLESIDDGRLAILKWLASMEV